MISKKGILMDDKLIRDGETGWYFGGIVLLGRA
jgi:hypothetical protein